MEGREVLFGFLLDASLILFWLYFACSSCIITSAGLGGHFLAFFCFWLIFMSANILLFFVGFVSACFLLIYVRLFAFDDMVFVFVDHVFAHNVANTGKWIDAGTLTNDGSWIKNGIAANFYVVTKHGTEFL